MTQRGLSNRALLVFAALLFVFVSVQVAVARQGGGSATTASHAGIHAKASKNQLRRLKQRIKALEAAIQAPVGPTQPTGAAGGDLTGTYPNPTIAGGVITDAKVAPANLDGSPATPSLRTLGTGAQQAMAGNAAAGGDLNGTYPAPGIAQDVIGARELTPVGSFFPDNTAPVEAVPFLVRFHANSGVGAQPDGTSVDNVIYDASAPRGFLVIDAWAVNSNPGEDAAWQLRDATGGGGSELASATTPAGVGALGRIDSLPFFPTPLPANGTLVVRMTDPSPGAGTWSAEFDLYVLAVPV